VPVHSFYNSFPRPTFRMRTNLLGRCSRIILQSLLIREPGHTKILILIFQTSTPATYTKYVAREMSKAEHLLKVGQLNMGDLEPYFNHMVSCAFVYHEMQGVLVICPGSTTFVYSLTHSETHYLSMFMFLLLIRM
jgi:hypothetical protein